MIAIPAALAFVIAPGQSTAIAMSHSTGTAIQFPTCSVCDSNCYEAYQRDMKHCDLFRNNAQRKLCRAEASQALGRCLASCKHRKCD
jgi:hypothetical protein